MSLTLTISPSSHLNYLISKSQSSVPCREAEGVNVVNEYLSVALLVLVLVAESQAQQLTGAALRSL